MRYLVLLFLFSNTVAFGQLKQKLADQHYQLMEYAQCVDMFDELADKFLKNEKKGNIENVRKAAISHYKLFQMGSACNYFEQLRLKNKLNESDRELYIAALRYDEKYGRSNELIRESANLFPDNKYFQRLNENVDNFNKLFTDSAFYSLKTASVNSGEGDFGVAYFGEAITFVSKSKNYGFINEKYGWDDAYFLNILQSNFNPDSTLNPPTLLKHEFVSRAHDGPVSFSPDLTEMVITKNELGKKNGKEVVHLSIYFSKIVNGEWSELEPFEFNNPSYDVGHAAFGPDGNTLYFASNKPGGIGGTDIYMSKRLGKGWGEPVNLGTAINTEKDELFPFVQDGMLYFASDGHYGLGGLDIFEAHLSGNEKPHNIGYPVNTSHDDFGLVFDKSGRIGFLSSNRKDNIDRIYHVKKKTINIDLEGDVYALYEKKEIVPDQPIYIKNMTSQEMDTIMADANGHFGYPLIMNQGYQIFTKKEEFILLEEVKLSTAEIHKDSTLRCELVLKPTTIIVHLRVLEKLTKKIIPAALTTITDYAIGWDTTLVTNQEGIVSLKVDRNKVFWAHGAKKGFIDADVSFNTSNQSGKVIDLELELPPIKKGEKFKLENIFYDLNKSTLRPESMKSLDKLADFIIKNDLKIELSAHTDSRGSKTYNQRLSQARAQSCVDYLISKGVKSYKIKAKGYGETQLVNGCKDGVKCSEEEHQENRRTEVKIL